jgi:spore germination protein KC
MKAMMKARLAAVIIIFAFLLTGCWDHTEVDQLSVVAGVAIDKGHDGRLLITVETVEVGFGKESEPKPKILTVEGETIFDAVRHIVAVIGKRLYWSHAKVVIVSHDLAEDGILQVLDWFSRDSETRTDINIIISKEPTASEILTSQPLSEAIVSFELYKTLDSQKKLNHSLDVEVWKFTNEIGGTGISGIAPAVRLKQVDGVKTPEFDVTGVFEGDKLIGFIDGTDTMYLLFVRDKINGGLLVLKEEGLGKGLEASLEIHNNKTKVKPVIKKDGSIEINIKTDTEVSIDEISSTENILALDRLKEVENLTEEMLKANIEGIIRKAQKEYATDMFGFGDKIRENCPSAWRIVEQDWNNVFKNIKVNVETNVRIRNSSMLSKPLEVGY